MELIHQPWTLWDRISTMVTDSCRKGGKPEYVRQRASKDSNKLACNPECLYWGVRFLYERYHLPIYITENGMACHDR